LPIDEPDPRIATLDLRILGQLIGAASAIGKNVFNTLGSLLDVFIVDTNGVQAGRDNTTGLYQVPLSMNASKVRHGPRDFVMDTLNAVNDDGSKKYPLDLRTNCLVTKITFTNGGASGQPQATGVEFMDGQSLYAADPRFNNASGTPGSVKASKEVIISAGAFNTPQLLKLSGIGPAAELQQFGIPVVKDLPGVGTNMQDRYEISVTATVDKPLNGLDECTWNAPGDPCITKWANNELGIYGTSGFAGAIMTRSSQAYSSDNDLFVFGGPANFTGYYTGWAEEAVRGSEHWVWAVLKAHTGNKAGTVTLRSANPQDVPEINFRYFDEGSNDQGQGDRDLNAVVEGMQMARKIYDSLPLGSPSWKEEMPGADASSQEDLANFVRDNSWGHHASCTCPIGADSDPMAVLDSQFRVRGVDGLRVVDASVFPDIPGFFIVMPIYMISEKAADVIINGNGAN
jgi:choline dehydrogenase